MNHELYLGDCLEILKEIPDSSVDIIYADPPYGHLVWTILYCYLSSHSVNDMIPAMKMGMKAILVTHGIERDIKVYDSFFMLRI